MSLAIVRDTGTVDTISRFTTVGMANTCSVFHRSTSHTWALLVVTELRKSVTV